MSRARCLGQGWRSSRCSCWSRSSPGRSEAHPTRYALPRGPPCLQTGNYWCKIILTGLGISRTVSSESGSGYFPRNYYLSQIINQLLIELTHISHIDKNYEIEQVMPESTALIRHGNSGKTTKYI